MRARCNEGNLQRPKLKKKKTEGRFMHGNNEAAVLIQMNMQILSSAILEADDVISKWSELHPGENWSEWP